MTPARGNSGKGIVIALVIFIVLALAGIGTSIWLAQQNSIIRQAARHNQQEFERTAGEVFEEQDWELDEDVQLPFGLRYGEEAYGQVGRKLEEAAKLEDMDAVLGWNTPEGVRDKIDSSPAQEDQTEPYSTIRGLLGHYEEEYERLNKRVTELKGQRDEAEAKLEDKGEAYDEMQKKLEKEVNDAVSEHQEKIAQLREQYTEMEQKRDSTREELDESRDKYDEASKEWENKVEEIEEEAQKWEKMYQQATAEDEEIDELSAEGKLIEVERRHEFVLLEGGKDINREVDQKLVVYTQTPDEKLEKKGEVVINEVYETTSLAVILDESERFLKGDLFVTSNEWDRYDDTSRVAKAEQKSRPGEKTDEADTEPTPDEEPESEPDEEPDEEAEEAEEAEETEPSEDAEQEEPDEEEEDDFKFEL